MSVTTESPVYEWIKAEGIAEGEVRGKAEGIAEGEVRGKAEGKAEGKVEGKAEVAKAMLIKGHSIPDITQVTGLSEKRAREAQISDLRASKGGGI